MAKAKDTIIYGGGRGGGKKFDALDQFEQQCAAQMGMGVAMLLWKNRFINPEMSVQVTPEDISKLDACVGYLGIKPKVVVLRPQGRPEQAERPAQGERKAIPYRPADPPKNYVVIQLVDENGDSFKAIENDEESAKLRDQATEIGKLKDRAGIVAQNILTEMQQNTTVDSTQREAARMLTEMARLLP